MGLCGSSQIVGNPQTCGFLWVWWVLEGFIASEKDRKSAVFFYFFERNLLFIEPFEFFGE